MPALRLVDGRTAWIIPVGGAEQRLLLIERQGNTFRETWCEAVRFVPLIAGTD